MINTKFAIVTMEKEIYMMQICVWIEDRKKVSVLEKFRAEDLKIIFDILRKKKMRKFTFVVPWD